MTVASWCNYWHREVLAIRAAPKTAANYRSTIDNHIAPAIGDVQLDQLTAADVRHMHALSRARVSKQGTPTSEATVLLAHNVLSIALSDARKEQLLYGDLLPTERVGKPTANASQRRPLDVAEAIHLLGHLDPDDPIATRWVTALLLGARQGELLGLQRDRVFDDHIELTWQLQHLDTDHGCARVPLTGGGRAPCGYERAAYCPTPRLRYQRPGLEYKHVEGGLFLTRPKSKSGVRVVPLVEPVRMLLQQHLAATEGGMWDLVWTKPDLSPIDPRGDQKSWGRLLAAAGLEPAPLHSARGVPASELARLGIGDAVRTDLMGWATARSGEPYERAERAAKIAGMEALTSAMRAKDALAHLMPKPAPVEVPDADDAAAVDQVA